VSEQSRGAAAVDAAADRYGFEVESARWYDGVSESGTKYEVKSTTGRGFRIWKDQHDSLRAADARGTAWYVFVEMTDRGGISRMMKRKPRTVTRYVEAAGGWNVSGHARRDGGGFERYLSPDTPF
jgi:hypothetical protein